MNPLEYHFRVIQYGVKLDTECHLQGKEIGEMHENVSLFEGGWIGNIHVSLMVFKQNFYAFMYPTSFFL